MTSYVASTEVSCRKRWHGAFIIAIIAALLSVFVAVPIAYSQQSHAVEWIDNLMCGNDLGAWTSYQPAKDSLTDGTDTVMSSGGKYSAMDIYSNVTVWTTWNGHNIADDKKGAFDMSYIQNVADLKDDAQKLADSQHNGISCVTKTLYTGIANFLLNIANLLVKFMSMFVTWAVNPKIICQDPAKPEGACINLVAIIGGTGGSNGGIIGILYNGLYLGLAPLAMVCVALWMLWKGIVKGEIRNSWFGLGWAVLCFVLGIFMMTNPMLLALAPMKISTTLGSCVIESINGRSCLSDSSADSSSTTASDASPNTLCLIDPSKSISTDEHLAIDARMATCKMWKAFVLEPWAQGQFGMSYEGLEGKAVDTFTQSDLITKSPAKDSLNSLWSNASVSLKGSSPDKLCQGTNYLYHNIALYQLDLMSDVHDCSGTGVVASYPGEDTSAKSSYHNTAKIKTNAGVYNDWYYIIATMTQAGNTKNASSGSSSDSGAMIIAHADDTGSNSGDSSLQHSYTMWAGNASATRISLSVVAIIAAIMAISIIAVDLIHLKPGAAILAIGYLFMGTILTVFAPLFMLVGIHPGVGKKMFLGWLELELSTIMKYFFIILWISIVVEIYGAILGSSTNAGLTLIFVIAMTTTLKTYQPELLNIFGNVDLGGKKLSNALGDKFSQKMNGARNMANAIAGGAAAGFVNGKGGLGNRLRSAADMSKYQGMQQGKRAGGFMGAAFQSADRIYDQRRQKALDKAKKMDEGATAAENEAKAREEAANTTANTLAAQGLHDSSGNELDYDNVDNTQIDAEAKKQTDEFLGKNGQKVIDLKDKVDKQVFDKSEKDMNNAATKYSNAVNVDKTTGVTTIDTAKLKASKASMADVKNLQEYAYRQNQKKMNELAGKATNVVGADGTVYKVFNNANDQAAWKATQNAVNDKKAINNHAAYQNNLQKSADALVKSSGVHGVADYGSLKSEASKLNAGVQNIENQKVASHQALDARNAYHQAHNATMATHAKTEEIRKVAGNIKDNNNGAMWSSDEVERMSNIVDDIDTSRAAAATAASGPKPTYINALGGVGSTKVTNGSVRREAAARTASTAAHKAGSAASSAAHKAKSWWSGAGGTGGSGSGRTPTPGGSGSGRTHP